MQTLKQGLFMVFNHSNRWTQIYTWQQEKMNKQTAESGSRFQTIRNMWAGSGKVGCKESTVNEPGQVWMLLRLMRQREAGEDDLGMRNWSAGVFFSTKTKQKNPQKVKCWMLSEHKQLNKHNNQQSDHIRLISVVWKPVRTWLIFSSRLPLKTTWDRSDSAVNLWNSNQAAWNLEAAAVVLITSPHVKLGSQDTSLSHSPKNYFLPETISGFCF